MLVTARERKKRRKAVGEDPRLVTAVHGGQPSKHWKEVKTREKGHSGPLEKQLTFSKDD